ncbi:MAG: ribonuclease D [Rhodospirillaceae bacterium]|nr:ribonuclease D [Rhodospirillaceae bacterium]
MTAKKPNIHLYKGDLPSGLDFGDAVAVDCEAMGLKNARDRLCVVQLSAGDGDCHLVQFAKGEYDAPNLKAVMANPKITKIFHFARFDVGILKHYLGVDCAPVYCTKIASQLARTYTDRHGLKDVCRELVGVELSKEQQSSDWGAETLSESQINYAAIDVLYLHQIRTELEKILAREGRTELAQKCFDFLETRAALDSAGWPDLDIFAH